MCKIGDEKMGQNQTGNQGPAWRNLGRAVAILTLFLSPFIVIVPDEYKPYLTAAVTGLNAINVYLSHQDNH
jgi:hypothetical protein